MRRRSVFYFLIGYNVYMTQISRDDVQHLAQLSSLHLSDSELDGLQADLSGILDYVQQLGELDTEGVEPTYQVTDLENVWRDDSVATGVVTREQLLALAPEAANNQVKVPKVLQ
jgi:aspartyl-tRNA(Asn)/glutamyl-tRNA(Gln) amidotransferase subunit C